MLLFQLLLLALFRLCLTYSDHGVALWQSVLKLGLPEANLWYGVITNAEQETTLEELFESLPADSSLLLNLVSDLHIASQFYVKDGPLNWFVLNKKRYTDPDDSFYLKTSDLEEQQKIPDDNMLFPDDYAVGTNEEAPLVILYGDLETEDFEDFNLNLYREAMQGKIRLVWRATTNSASIGNSEISKAYPYELSVNSESWGSKVTGDFDVPTEYISDRYQLGGVDSNSLHQLDLKATALLTEDFKKHKDLNKTLTYARKLINNFPILASQLSHTKVSIDQTEESLRKFLDLGINYDAIGVYLNGQHWRLSSLNPWSFLSAVLSEQENFSKLLQLLAEKYPTVGASESKNILQQYSKLEVLNLQTLQPVRYDFHRIPGFSNSIIYFNDIEKDEQYHNLTKDFDAFHRDSKFGELPEYRENWNEVIFVIDFDNIGSRQSREILAGLNRALEVVAMGYPQRIGLLPLYHGRANNLVKKIYKLKNEGLDKLEKFLSELRPESDVESVRFEEIPPVRDILEKFRISSNSIIVNGQIYPFKNNNWNYLLSKAIKNDVAFLRNTIKRTNFTNARDLLHSRSFSIRNLEYIPDFFEDSSFTSVNTDALNGLKKRTMYFDNNSGHVLLHTLTLVDDFSSKPALERLLNLLAVKINGVRFRLIHVGTYDKQWKQLASFFKEEKNIESFMVQLSKLAKKSKQTVYYDPSLSGLLRNFLPKLPGEFVSNKTFILLNGRYMYVKPNEVLTSNTVDAILQRDARRTIDFIGVLTSQVPTANDLDLAPDFVEQAVSYLSYLFYAGTSIFNNGIEYTSESTLPRLDILSFFDSEMKSSSIIAENRNSLVDVTIVMDPLEERTQKFLYLASLVKDLSFVQINLVMLPTKNLTFFPIHRIYSDTKVSVEPENVFTTSRDLPFNLFRTDSTTDVIVEAHVFSESAPVTRSNVESQESGVCLELLDSESNPIAMGMSMKTFGYTQFALPGFQHNLTVRSCDDRYEVTSFSYNGKSDYVSTPVFHVTDLSQRKLYVKVKQITPISKPQLQQSAEDNTIHIFVTIKDVNDQASFKQKLVSIYTNVSSDINLHFWLLQNERFEQSLTDLMTYIKNETDGRIKFSSVAYQWPAWLRPQRFHDRRLDATRVLFLDVIPSLSKVKKLVMLSLDEPNTPDLHAMYSKTSKACFTMRVHTDDGYWKTGYWEKFLKENRLDFYDASSSFIVNMDCYREKDAGHTLRVHYQHSSADINALADIDQDLLNSVQKFIKIRPLRKITTIPVASADKIKKLDTFVSKYGSILHDSTSVTENDSDDEHTYLHDEL